MWSRLSAAEIYEHERISAEEQDNQRKRRRKLVEARAEGRDVEGCVWRLYGPMKQNESDGYL